AEKMTKSTGRVLLLDDLVARGFDPLAFRYFFLQAHYRQQQTRSDAAMEAAQTGYQRLLGAAAEVRDVTEPPDPALLEAPRARFRAAIRDDLNAPKALEAVWAVARSKLPAAARRALLLEFDEVLGLGLATETPRAAVQERDPRIDALVAARDAARARRDF